MKTAHEELGAVEWNLYNRWLDMFLNQEKAAIDFDFDKRWIYFIVTGNFDIFSNPRSVILK